MLVTLKNKLLSPKSGPFYAFLLPFLSMALIYLLTGIYPGSSRSILASDAFSQFSNFHASYRNMLLGKQGLFYTWNASLGLNFYALASYYLGGFLTPLVIFFPNKYMPDALYFLTLIKIGLAGSSFYFYARRFKLGGKITVAFSTAYALMSFICAHSELIMWLDAFIFLPLVILGIEKLQDGGKPTLLFVSYFLVFTSNFYFGFMVGLFSFLYFVARTIVNWAWAKRKILAYFITSLLAGGASMIVILPTVLDLRTNGETLTEITKLKTAATGPFDILMKNMVGVYDTTKYGSIPFIYIGLIPFVFCLFYFVTKKVNLKSKLAYLGLFAFIIASFYFVPLNLFWHGMHAPNMFLFRYSFAFSFLVVALALRSFRLYTKKDFPILAGIILFLSLGFILGKVFLGNQYAYISIWSVVLSVCLLVIYLLIFGMVPVVGLSKNIFSTLLLGIMVVEALINGGGMVKGILDEWNYASRSLYTNPYSSISTLVNDSSEDEFFRLENNDGVSSNDSFNYGYSGISMFSSIRNRNSSSLLNTLGFRSKGTNLNIRYANNTLLMDTVFGIGYNIQKSDPLKYGYTQVSVANDYGLYKNAYASSLGVLTDATLNDLEFPEFDNLTSQENLFNQLAGTNFSFFQLTEPLVTEYNNTTMTQNTNTVTYEEETSNVAKEVHYQVTVPKGKQAYLSLYPMNYGELGSSTVTISVNGQSQKSQINITGQYYNLGYYLEDTTVDFVASFYGSEKVTLMPLKVVLLDLNNFQQAAEKIQTNGVPFTTTNNGATATINTEKAKTLFTTIPYDAGWSAYLDGQKIPVNKFKDALISLNIPKGKHTLVLKFLPQGFKLGLLLCITCLILFVFYLRFLTKKAKK